MKWEKVKKLFSFTGLAKNNLKDILPNVCPKCGAKYRNSDDFFAKTEEVSSVIRKTESEKPIKINLECRCSICSYLFKINSDKGRDTSKEGVYVRSKFGEILEMLISEGMDREVAKNEVLKLFDEQKRTSKK